MDSSSVYQLMLPSSRPRISSVTIFKPRAQQPKTLMQSSPIPRRQRASRACDFCHDRGLKCRRRAIEQSHASSIGCLTCADYGVQCTMKRPIRRRGRKPTVARTNSVENPQTHTRYDAEDPSVNHLTTPDSATAPGSELTQMRNIHRLVRIYRDTMYQC